MEINRILIASPMYKELEAIIKTKDVFAKKQFRFRSEETVLEVDYEWADVFVAFQRPANFQFKNIKWVHSLGAGVDKILNGIKWKESVLLTRMIGPFGQKMSEYCLSYILQDYQHHFQLQTKQKERQWDPIAPIPLKEKKVVIFGTGAIGEEIAKTLSYFHMQVYGVSLSGRQKSHFKKIYSSNTDLSELLTDADVVINTMPLTQQTRLFFNEVLFTLLNGAMFINVGRGESVDDDALLQALNNGKVRRAILDVFHDEPLPTNSPLWSHPGVTITPHISAVTTPEEGVDYFIETLAKVERGEEITNKVDLQKGF